MELCSVFVILLSSAFDALRDAWMKTEGWWKRHIVKWISFYTPLIFIMVTNISWIYWIPVTLSAWIVWRLSVQYIGGKKWTSMWFKGGGE